MNDLHITPNLKVYTKHEARIGFTNGKCIGTVDHLEGNGYIKLKMNDSSDGKHHWIPATWIDRVDGLAVHLHKTLEQVQRDYLSELPDHDR